MPKWFTPAAIVCGLMFAASPFLIANADYEATMGLVQKIFYYHMPSASMFLLSGIVCGIASARYLFGGSPRQDRVAWSAAELARAAMRRRSSAIRSSPCSLRSGSHSWALPTRS